MNKRHPADVNLLISTPQPNRQNNFSSLFVQKVFVSKICREENRERFLVLVETAKCLDGLKIGRVMSNRKFFSGLPDAMMKSRNSSGPDRQQTNFYWPNETDTEQFVSPRNRMRNRSMSTASLMSQASTDTEESRRRKSQANQSKIEFYDMVDNTDNESIYSRSNDLNKHKKQQTLKSRIEFYDFADTKNDDDAQSVVERPTKRNLEPSVEHIIPMTTENGYKDKVESVKEKCESQSVQNLSQSVQNLNLSPEPKNGFASSQYPPGNPRKKTSQYVDSFSESDDDERYYRARNHPVDERKYLPPRYPPPPRSVRSHPCRAEYFDFDDEEYDRQYDSRRLKYRKPEIAPRMSRRREYSPEVSDEDFYDNVDGYRRSGGYREARGPDRYRSSNASRIDDSESYYRGRSNRRPTNGYGSEVDFQRNSAPARRPSPRASPRVSPQNQQNEAQAPQNGHEIEVEPRMPASARPPVKPVTRSNSISEAKQRYHVNLKSNIFHNDPEYDQVVGQRKPVSVRDFAARQRVGVGLPDI